jgi:hypothetical protein
MKTSDIQHNILTIDLTEDQLTAEPTEMSPDMMVSSSSSSSSSSNSSSKHTGTTVMPRVEFHPATEKAETTNFKCYQPHIPRPAKNK